MRHFILVLTPFIFFIINFKTGWAKSMKPRPHHKTNTNPSPTKDRISKKKGLIYYDDRVIPVLYPDSFEPLVEGYSRDSKNLYFEQFRIYKADPNTFNPTKYAMTSKGMRWGSYGTVKGGLLFAEHFLPVEDEKKIKWGDTPLNDGKNGYKESSDYGFQKIEGLDISTLKHVPISPYYVDKNSVYLRWEKLVDCNPKKFEHIMGPLSKCGNNYYYDTELLVGDFPESWKKSGYANGGYFFFRPKPGYAFPLKSDSKEIKEIKYGYDEVRGEIYSNYRQLQGLNKDSYKILDNYHVVDDKSVYYRHNKIKGADPKTFKVPEGYELGFDKNHAYYAGRVIINLPNNQKDPRLKDTYNMRIINDTEVVYMGSLTEASSDKDVQRQKPR